MVEQHAGREPAAHPHDGSQHPHDRDADGHQHGVLQARSRPELRVLAIATAGIAVVAAVELYIALASHSAGILADGLHNLGDVSTTLALALAFLLSRRAAN